MSRTPPNWESNNRERRAPRDDSHALILLPDKSLSNRNIEYLSGVPRSTVSRWRLTLTLAIAAAPQPSSAPRADEISAPPSPPAVDAPSPA